MNQQLAEQFEGRGASGSVVKEIQEAGGVWSKVRLKAGSKSWFWQFSDGSVGVFFPEIATDSTFLTARNPRDLERKLLAVRGAGGVVRFRRRLRRELPAEVTEITQSPTKPRRQETSSVV